MSHCSDQDVAMVGADLVSLHTEVPEEGLVRKIILLLSELLGTAHPSFHGAAGKYWEDFWHACGVLLKYEGDIAAKTRSEISLSRCADIASLKDVIEGLRIKYDQSLRMPERKHEGSKSQLVAMEKNLSQLQSDLETKEELLHQLQSDLKAKDDHLIEVESRPDSKIVQLENELASRDEKIHDLKNQQKTLTTQYRSQIQDNRKLHAIVTRNAQEIDPYDDQYITKQFTALGGHIERVVRKHFSANRTKTGWKEYDSIRELDDRDYFLQSYIATALANKFFSHNARIFGLDEKTEPHQANFERQLQEHHVPPSEIACWRVQTIKVSELMSSKNRDLRAVQIPSELFKNLRDVCYSVSQPKFWPSARSALQALCASAFDLAFALRHCRVEYEWRQSAPSYPADDVESIENYNVGAKRPTNDCSLVLFGPVYKHVEGVPVRLRHGTVLRS